MRIYFIFILLLIVVVALVTFGIENEEPIKLQYYVESISIQSPIWGIVYASILIGIFIGMMVGIGSRFGQRKKIKQLQKENRDLKDKVGELEKEETPEEETPEEETAVVEKEAQPNDTQEIPYEPEDKEEQKEAGL